MTKFLLKRSACNLKNTIAALSLSILLFLPLLSFGQNKNITIKVTDGKLSDVFELIEKQAGYNFFYNNDLIDGSKTISLDVKDENVQNVLKKLFDNTNISYNINNNDIILSVTQTSQTVASQQKNQITGNVTDATTSMALPFVSVSVKGTTTGINTDDNGNYSIIVPNSNATLVFSFVGYTPIEQIVGTKTNIDIQLQPETTQLGAVVVTALGIKREEKALGYVTQKVAGDNLQTVKGTTVGSSLTGKVAGMQVLNSTEFMQNPSITIRGASPILVVDGVPAYNININDINQDDIESMDILKGATASALYGSRGGNGAIIITTKRSDKKGFSISVNTSNMFHSGFLAIPEVQTSYSAGLNGGYNLSGLDYVWGQKLDIGKMAEQWDPVLKEKRTFELKSIGKNNFKNFLEAGYVSNTSISVSQQGENGSVRASASYMRHKHPYPNALGHQLGYTVSGEMKLGSKISVEGSVGLSKRWAPNVAGTGYNEQGYIYNILVWTGPEYDLRQYRDYWITPDQKQNWHYNGWYDNPYLSAYEKTEAIDNNKMNAMFALNYEITDWMKMIVRSGYDYYSNNTERRAPQGINSIRSWGNTSKGYYYNYETNGLSTNNDLILMADKKFGKFGIDGLVGGTIFYRQSRQLWAASKGGLTIPGFYSLYNSVESPTVGQSMNQKGVNSLYAKATLDYDGKVFVDVTGRNDWSSTLPSNENSYFYPSVAASVLTSEFITLPKWFSFWKVRGSWAVSKEDLGVYDINNDYTTSSNVWNGMNTAYYPSSIRGNIKPVTHRTFEVGTAMNFMKSRIKFDFTFYNKHTYNRTVSTTVSELSGFNSKLINIDEEYVRRGFEIILEGKPIDAKDLKWSVQTNWSTSRNYYKKLDPEYSANNPWVKVGNRTDYYTYTDFQRDPQGNIIHSSSGYPVRNSYSSLLGHSSPNWNWGLTNTVTWKRFTFNLAFDGRIGGISYSTTQDYLWDAGGHPDSDNQWRYNEVVEGKKDYNRGGVLVKSGKVEYSDNYGTISSDTRVFEPNTIGTSYQNYTRRYMCYGAFPYLDETFVKLRELSITYDIPQNIAKKFGMSSASISAIGQNLFLWAKEFRFSDPDTASDGLATPSVRYIGFNLKLNF